MSSGKEKNTKNTVQKTDENPSVQDNDPSLDENPSVGNLFTDLKNAWGGPSFSPFRVLLNFFTYHWNIIHKESLDKNTTFRLQPLVVLSMAAIFLTLMQYYGSGGKFLSFCKDLAESTGVLSEWANSIYTGDYRRLWGFGYWSFWRLLGYVLLPLLVIWILPGEKVSDYGLSLKKAGSHYRIYFLLFFAVLPAVFLASFDEGFQTTYPFYKNAGRSWEDFLIFEFLYGLQFFSLEFFFRGFLLHGVKRQMGAYSIFVMIVPYCMIHFGKPFPETMGAIGAGLILGTLSLRTNSIWGGVGIHIAVAVTMDVLALWHAGVF